MIKYNINGNLIVSDKIDELINKPIIVDVIGNFDEKQDKTFIESCDKALQTGQTILPIRIDSYGGHAYSVIGLMDYIDNIRNQGIEVVTICVGKAMSCGSILFCMGDRRYVGDRSMLLFHRVSGWTHGNQDDIQVEAEEIKRLDNTIYNDLSIRMGKEKNYLLSKMKEKNYADWYVTSKLAKKEGIATDIGIPTFEVNIDTEFVIG